MLRPEGLGHWLRILALVASAAVADTDHAVQAVDGEVVRRPTL